MTTVSLFDAHHDFDAAGALRGVFESGYLAGGAPVLALEKAVSDLCQQRPVVSVANMTQALALALHLAGVGEDDDVLTMSFNCMSSTTCINMVGAKAVWIDVDPTWACLDMNDVRTALTPSTKALIVYQLAGYPVCMDDVIDFCRQHKLVLIEDSNNAWLSADAHTRPISQVDFLYFSVFSLYANRQVNGIEGALLVCPSESLAKKARCWTRYGIDSNNFRLPNGEINPGCDIIEQGVNATLNAVNATLALMHLTSLPARVDQCRLHARILLSACAGNPLIQAVQWDEDRLPAFWGFLLLSPDHELLKEYLRVHGFQSSFLHLPNHLYSVFTSIKRHLPGTVTLQRQLLAVPCGWWLSQSDISTLADCLRSFKGKNSNV